MLSRSRASEAKLAPASAMIAAMAKSISQILTKLVAQDLTTVGALPERVRRAVRDEQDQAERLISWCQLALVVFFGVFYLVGTKPADRPMRFQPVPYALAAYLVATLVRIVWSHRTRLPRWSLAGSILIDMSLLFGLIWSFHIQYAQPPAFYLKAPTILYVFIFIALRALRFDAALVLLAGVAAAGGWIALVVYAATFGPDAMPITRDYVRYMTSNLILIGAEIDKVVAILVVSLLLAWSLLRAQRTLVSAVAGTSAVRELRRFFSDDVADVITGSEESIKPGQGMVRDAAAMFIDLRGFTELARSLSPDQTVQLLAEYQARLVPVLQRHGGSIDKFLGDGILASFGASRVNARYAADALSAIDALMDEVAQWQADRKAAGLPSPRVGAAVAIGPLLFGAVGDATRLEYTVIGDAVNLAAKLEKHTKVERVAALTTVDTYDTACRQGFVGAKEKRNARTVAGVGEPIDLVVLA